MRSASAWTTSPASTTRRTVHLAVGRFSPTIGGPYQTVTAYRRALQRHHEVRLVAIRNDQAGPPADAHKDTYLHAGWSGWSKLLAHAWRVRSDDLVVFGVWHRVFFVVALVRLVIGTRRSGRRTLVPTQSLSKWDWAKHRRIKFLLRPLVAVALSQLDLVIFATEGERETSVPQLAPEKTTVIYHPIEPVDHATRPRTTLRGPRVAFVGRLVAQKDLRLLLSTVALLPATWSADIIGSGDEAYRALLVRDAERLGCSERVRWHGWLPRSEMHSIVAGANALLITSHAENYSHAAIEAMALSVPVVMVDRVAAATDVRRHQTGLVTAADPRSLATAILSLQDRRSTSRRTLVARAAEFAQARESGADSDRLLGAVTGGR
jgi:glycosyltransferase involved in cell wall biosynthesis